MEPPITSSGRHPTLTFLFTDVEGSTARWEEHQEAMRTALARHDALLRRTVADHGGHVFKTVGDAFCAAFSGAYATIAAALAAQSALAGDGFAEVGGLKVRMALHAGEVEARDGDYFGRPLNKVARLLSAAHGGQVVVSSAVAELLSHRLPFGASLSDLGRHRLRDLAAPEQVYQLLGPGLARSFPPLRSLDALPNNLPQLPNALIGRERELAEIEALLTEHRLVTLVGAGGIGKTSLSLQAGADLLGRFPDGVWLVELAPLDRAELVGEAVAALFGLPVQEGRSTADAMAAFLRSKRLLLILDNCEHLVASVARLADALLKVCPGVSLLASSREALAVPGEHAYPVPLLDVPPRSSGLTAAQAMGHSAVRLFVERAGSALGRFSLTNETAPAVAEICRRLDGIPLAIELAAPRLKMLKPEDLLARLDDRLRLLAVGSRTAVPRQQTLRALIDWSHALLADAEQAVLRRLGVFAGSFTLEAVTAVATGVPVEEWEAFDLLAGLVDKSLVVPLAGEGTSRYRLLESTRAFALEKLAASSDSVLSRRLCEHMTLVFERAEQAWPTAPTAEWLAAYEPDLDNLRAALAWSLRPDGDPALGLRLVGRTDWLWRELSLLQERRRWFELAAGFLDAATPPTIAARIHMALGWPSYFGERDRLPHSQRAIQLLRGANEPELLAQALQHASRAASRYRDTDEATAYLDEAMALLRPRGRTKLLGTLLYLLAIVRKHAGDVPGARAFVDEGLTLAAALGDRPTHDALILQVASIDFEDGRLTDAIVRARTSVETSRRSGNVRIHCMAQQWLAGFLLLGGDAAAGRDSARKGFSLSRSLGNLNLADSLDQLALAAAMHGDVAAAARLSGYGDGYVTLHGISRFGISYAVRNRLLQRLDAGLPGVDRAVFVAEGAAWSEGEAVAAAQAL